MSSSNPNQPNDVRSASLTGDRRRPLKITFVTIVPSPYQKDLFKALASRNDVNLNVEYMEAASPDSPWPAVPLAAYERLMPGCWLPFAGGRVHVNWRLPEVSNADIVVVSSFTSVTGQLLMRYRLPGKRWIYWGERLRRHRGWKGFIQRVLAAPLANASALVGTGREASSEYRRRFTRPLHFSVPYYCELSGFRAARREVSASTEVRFLFCGQIIERKGVDLLFKAFDGLIAKGGSAELWLVGRKGELERFLPIVGASARSRIRYLGFMPPQKLPEIFAQSDVFVLPSRHDGWGVVINQAIGSGLPIIASDAVGAALDLVEHDVNGLHFAAGDAGALQEAMERVVAERSLLGRWGDASKAKAFDLSPDAGARMWVNVFNEVMANASLVGGARYEFTRNTAITP